MAPLLAATAFTPFDYVNLIILVWIFVGSTVVAIIRMVTLTPVRKPTLVFVYGGVAWFFLGYSISFGIIRYYGLYDLPESSTAVAIATHPLRVLVTIVPLAAGLVLLLLELATYGVAARKDVPPLTDTEQKALDTMQAKIDELRAQGHRPTNEGTAQ